MNYLDRRSIIAHSLQAKIEGKCIQCQHPWYDGTCSCGKWGEQEKNIEAVVNKIEGEKEAKEELKREIESQEEVRRIDESLLGVEDLSDKLWGNK